MYKKGNRGRPPGHPRVRNVTLGTSHATYEDAAEELRKLGHPTAHRAKVYTCCNGGQQTHCGCRFEFEKKRNS